MYMDREELLCGRWLPLQVKGIVYENYAMLVILYMREVWCLQENDMGILRVERATCGIRLTQRRS